MSTPAARKLAIALLVSVGLNLFLGGMIASAWIAKRHYDERPGRPPVAGLAGDFNFRSGIEALGREARPMAREIRREYSPRFREAGGAMHEARREVGRILRGDDLDPAALEAALGELRRRSDAAQAVMHEVLVKTVSSLTSEQRRKFLEAATQSRRPRGDRPLPPPGGPPPGGPPPGNPG